MNAAQGKGESIVLWTTFCVSLVKKEKKNYMTIYSLRYALNLGN